MNSIGARMLFFVWGYDLIWFLIQDVSKVFFLRMLKNYYDNREEGGKVYHGMFLTDSFLQFDTGN
jgi:hypothetical protein